MHNPSHMSLRDLLNVQTRSRAWIEARLGTLYHHAEACAHRVAASPSVRPGSQGRNLEISRSRPNWRPMTPPVLRVGPPMCIIKVCMPRVSSGLPVNSAPQRSAPLPCRGPIWIIIYCATSDRVEFRPAWVADMFPHWGSYVGWGVCHIRIPTERPPTAPRSPIGLNTMPDCAPILRNLKWKCIIFFMHVCPQPKFTG